MDKREVAIFLNAQSGRELLGNYVFAAEEFNRLEKHFQEYAGMEGVVGAFDCEERCPDNAMLVTHKRLILRFDQVSVIA